MRNEAFEILKVIPKWKIIFWLLLALLLTPITEVVMYRLVTSVIDSSLTLTELNKEIVRIIGYEKYRGLKESLWAMMISYLYWFSIFSFYVYIFYRHEKKLYYGACIKKMIEEIRYIANGNFNHKVSILQHNYLKDLATGVNQIVEQLKVSIEEERQTEQAKSELITNVSHDLRTPLTSIVGYVNLIHDDNYRDEVELRHYIQVIYDKVNRLNMLMNDLFEYTRVQNKELSLNYVPIDMIELLGQLTVQFRIQLQEANIECRPSFPSQKLMVLADGDKLVRVFENLIINAITYGSDGNNIDITAYEINNMITIEITNYGQPIPSTDLPHIFERFYRVEKSRSTYTGGSGLGLAISKSIVELHNGTIEVYSDEEKTTFTVKLLPYK
ncbi:two-component sensor histidine kinase [Bacillus pseudomycoides]|uniref:histidine kinase n=1 Tax=Bacillus pseudomycoides TaxID=64104 RepID=A0AA91ZT70_9BACI|nr:MULTISPECIES: HAMP domain-containing sensor histidine kinase [Bacillus]PEB51801.1 two-component sensor histidine kinase [Bacillus sp. AFS098217]PED82450.1 two-component sensor histidine kinase [Bacillus pseudomycoides]PEU06468.1 two-component sensor histidine kinase [Bacillus sp. AFS019443]PEU16670.1 two-component sensor histidine kinase [Bacillus sp. AFS014408]PFW63987.1 two-component sensor histidine kinase [Bacillus sp. AFS075034]